MVAIEQRRFGIIRSRYRLFFHFSSGNSLTLSPNYSDRLAIYVSGRRPQDESDFSRESSVFEEDLTQESSFHLDLLNRFGELKVKRADVSISLDHAKGQADNEYIRFMLDKHGELSPLFFLEQHWTNFYLEATSQKMENILVEFYCFPNAGGMTMHSMTRQSEGKILSGFNLRLQSRD